MSQTSRYSPPLTVAVMLAALMWPAIAAAQLGGLLPPPPTSSATFSGSAQAIQASVFGTTTALAATGTLGGSSDARQASAATANVPSLLSGEALHAVTIGWPDQVASEASIGSLGFTVAGTNVSADLVMARALAVTNAAGSGSSDVENLVINGAFITVTGAPNQTISIPGGQVTINEQKTSPGGTTVNALHIVVTGVADVVMASATAGIS